MIRRTTGLTGIVCWVGLLVMAGAGTFGGIRAAYGKAHAPSVAGQGEIPELLRPWTGWVLHGHENERCPTLAGADDDQSGVCVWAGRLALTLDNRGGHFTQDFEVFAAGAVALPGGPGAWPLDVKSDGHAAVVLPAADGEAPTVRLPLGRHTVQGSFVWRHLPEALPVPSSTALLGLTLLGRSVEFPSRSAEGELFLQKQEEEVAEEDQLDIAVHRQVVDDVPMMLTTRVVLNVSGKTREVVLGRSLPSGFLPHTIDAPLPVRIEADGRLRVQLRPGTWTITLAARQNAPVTKLQRPVPDGPWKEGDEVWAFAARPTLRTVTVEGVPTIDPQQTTLPDEWKKLPAYLMVAGATMTLNERHRGDANPAVDRLTLQRQLWLDFDGGGLTARDQISGTFLRGWRLTMGPESKLGRVSVEGQDQFITRLGQEGPEGVEIRQSYVNLVAESRIAARPRDLPAVGWAADFQSVSATLALPPGWRLVHASGADSVSHTWIMGWTLLDLFLLLVTSLGIGKVFGWRTGVLALVTLALVLPQDDAPKWIWLAVLLAESLARALRAGRLRWAAGIARLATWVLLVVFAIPFAVQEIRVGLHPALGAREDTSAYRARGDRYQSMVENLAPSKAEDFAAEVPKDSVADPAEATIGLGNLGSIGRISEQMAGVSAGKRKVPGWRAETQNLASYDPNVMVQTGPGVPHWVWNDVQLAWNGPVEKEQRLRLWLLPPSLNLILGFVRVILMAWLILLIVGGRRGWESGLRLASPRAATVALLLALGAWAPANALAADVTADQPAKLPGEPLLEQLRERLLEKPPCHPTCASLGRLALDAAPDRLRLRLEVGAVAPATVSLPAHAKHWLPDIVLVDRKPATTLTRSDDGQLWLQVDTGSHEVLMEGPLPPREVVQLPFKLLPRAVTVTAHGWKVEGLTEDGQIDGNLQLSRSGVKAVAAVGDERKTQALDAASLPPFVLVERTLELGLKWQARTRVMRQTSPGSAVVLDIPLLPGESVVSSGVHVTKGHVQVNLGAGESETSWSSTLAERAELVLQAPAPGGAAATSWSEAWFVNASPVWHVVFSGIPPVEVPSESRVRVPSFRPWPGESVKIAISKPTGTAGQTLTIDHAELEISPGLRSTQSDLTLSLRSSRGGEHTLTLPEGAVVDSVAVNQAKLPPRQDHRRLTLPVAPGAQKVKISFREPVGLTSYFRGSPVDLGVAAVNVDLSIAVPQDRWVLMVGGPPMGPAVLFWSSLLVLIVVAVGLGRTHLAPLSTLQWILLGIGLSQTGAAGAAVVAGVLLAFGWRRRRDPSARIWLYNLGQLGFALWTLVAAIVLFSAIRQGLLSRPDMGIAGNNSNPNALKWFADRSPGLLPQPFLLSVPLLVYRLIMLGWALWLAWAVIRWSRWIWECFTYGTLWRSRLPLPSPPVPPPKTE